MSPDKVIIFVGGGGGGGGGGWGGVAMKRNDNFVWGSFSQSQNKEPTKKVFQFSHKNSPFANLLIIVMALIAN